MGYFLPAPYFFSSSQLSWRGALRKFFPCVSGSTGAWLCAWQSCFPVCHIWSFCGGTDIDSSRWRRPLPKSPGLSSPTVPLSSWISYLTGRTRIPQFRPLRTCPHPSHAEEAPPLRSLLCHLPSGERYKYITTRNFRQLHAITK